MNYRIMLTLNIFSEKGEKYCRLIEIDVLQITINEFFCGIYVPEGRVFHFKHRYLQIRVEIRTGRARYQFRKNDRITFVKFVVYSILSHLVD